MKPPRDGGCAGEYLYEALADMKAEGAPRRRAAEIMPLAAHKCWGGDEVPICRRPYLSGGIIDASSIVARAIIASATRELRHRRAGDNALLADRSILAENKPARANCHVGKVSNHGMSLDATKARRLRNDIWHAARAGLTDDVHFRPAE